MSEAPIDLERTGPSDLLRVAHEPNYKGEHMNVHNAQAIELAIPMELFNENAHSLTQMKSKYNNLRTDYTKLLSAMFQLAYISRASGNAQLMWSRVPRKDNPSQFVQMRVRLWSRTTREGESLDRRFYNMVMQNEKLHNSNVGAAMRTDAMGGGHHDASSSCASAASSLPMSSMPGGAGGPGAANVEGMPGPGGARGSLAGGRGMGGGSVRAARVIPTHKLLPYQLIHKAEWKRLSTWLMCRPHPDNVEGMSDSKNFYSISNVLSIENSLLAAYRLKADHEYCTARNYFLYHHNNTAQRIKYVFPCDGKHVYRINIPEITGSNFTHVALPWCTKPNDTFNPERQLFLSQHLESDQPEFLLDAEGKRNYKKRFTCESELESSQRAAKRQMTAKEKEDIYENQVNKYTSMDSAPTFAKVADLNAKTLDAYEKLGATSSEQCLAYRNKCKRELLKDFMDGLWTEDAQIPSAIKAIVKHYYSLLKSHRNLCMPRAKVTSNLDRFGDMMASLQAQLDTSFEVNTVHMEFIGCWLSGLQGYSGSEFHRHVLAMGPAYSGKSHMYYLLQVIAIDGTVQTYTMSTPKAKTANSDIFEGMWEIYPEVIPSTLGINTKAGGKAAETNGADGESLLKDQLTSGVMRVQSLVIVNGVRHVTQQKVPCNCVVFMASNEHANSVPPAMASRFSLLRFQNKFRADTNGLTGQMGRTRNDAEADLLTRRMRRTQMLSCLIFKLIQTNILKKIDMTVAHILIPQTLELAGKRHLRGTENIRHYKRITYLVESLVILDAIDKVFDSPDSPLLNAPWDIEHIFHVEKHLVAKEKHITYAFGIEEHSFEDKIAHDVITYLRDEIVAVRAAENERLVCESDKFVIQKHANERDEKEIEIHRNRIQQLQTFIQRKENMEDADVATANDAEEAYHLQKKIAAIEERLVLGREEFARLEQVRLSNLHSAYHVGSTFDFATGEWCVSIPAAERSGSGGGHGGHGANMGQKVSSLAAKIHAGILPKPQLEDIRTALFQLADQLVKRPNGTNSTALRFDYQGNMYVSGDVLRTASSNKNVLFSCLQETRSYPGCRASTYLYGTALENHPQVCNVMEIKARPHNSAEPMVVRNVNFHEPALLKMKNNALEGVQNAVIDEMFRVQLKEDVKSLAYIVIDSPLDDYATTRHNIKIKLTEEEKQQHPSNFTHVFDSRSMQNVPADAQHYPNAFRRLNPEYVRQERNEVLAKPQEYSLSRMVHDLNSDQRNFIDQDELNRYTRLQQVQDDLDEKESARQYEDEFAAGEDADDSEDTREHSREEGETEPSERVSPVREREAEEEEEEEEEEDIAEEPESLLATPRARMPFPQRAASSPTSSYFLPSSPDVRSVSTPSHVEGNAQEDEDEEAQYARITMRMQQQGRRRAPTIPSREDDDDEEHNTSSLARITVTSSQEA